MQNISNKIVDFQIKVNNCFNLHRNSIEVVKKLVDRVIKPMKNKRKNLK